MPTQSRKATTLLHKKKKGHHATQYTLPFFSNPNKEAKIRLKLTLDKKNHYQFTTKN
jgi:hypothetical protein